MSRCALCGNRDRHVRAAGWRECTHCAMRYAPDTRPIARVTEDLATRLAEPRIDLRADPPVGWTCAIPTLRIAGYRFGRAIRPATTEQATALATGDTTLPVHAHAAPLGTTGPAITLGLLGRPADLPAIDALLIRLAPHFAATRVLIDSADPACIAGRKGYAIHPMNGDFGNQRNRLQDLSDTEWMLQIDTDEDLEPALLAALSPLAADADRHGLTSLAFPRRNLVDGAQSDHWPDVQYRLNRRTVRFAGSVHERPEPSRDWRHAALAPAGAILHQLDAARVRARTRIYGAMDRNGARPADEDALLRPFDSA